MFIKLKTKEKQKPNHCRVIKSQPWKRSPVTALFYKGGDRGAYCDTGRRSRDGGGPWGAPPPTALSSPHRCYFPPPPPLPASAVFKWLSMQAGHKKSLEPGFVNATRCVTGRAGRSTSASAMQARSPGAHGEQTLLNFKVTEDAHSVLLSGIFSCFSTAKASAAVLAVISSAQGTLLPGGGLHFPQTRL